MEKLSSYLKSSGSRFLRNTSLHFFISHIDNNSTLLHKRTLSFSQRFIILFRRCIEKTIILKYKMCDKNINGKYLIPPEAVRGMKNLDRNAFTRSIQIPCLAVAADKVAPVLKAVKPYVLKLNNFKPLQETENVQIKHLYFNPDTIRCFDDFKEHKMTLLKEGINENDLFWKNMSIGYDNWNSDAILKAILPLDQTGTSGYSIVGHILHLNLKNHLLEYKNVIGQVLVDKIHNIRTVVNKTSIIDSKYRNFSMEVLGGENDMNVCVKENGCTYKFDFSKVYWNPRLSTEHLKLTSKLKHGDILFDVFAGVGPFAIPAAKRKCMVLANDLNPDSFHWLRSNATLNKVAAYIQCFNMDGRDFIYQVVRPNILKIWEEKTLQTMHIVMNLPASSVEFLDSFIGLGNGASEVSENLPVVHCYCFVMGSGHYNELALQSVEEHLNCKLESNLEELHRVRNVAPNKEMVRVSFRIPKKVLFTECNLSDEPLIKKSRICDAP